MLFPSAHIRCATCFMLVASLIAPGTAILMADPQDALSAAADRAFRAGQRDADRAVASFAGPEAMLDRAEKPVDETIVLSDDMINVSELEAAVDDDEMYYLEMMDAAR